MRSPILAAALGIAALVAAVVLSGCATMPGDDKRQAPPAAFDCTAAMPWLSVGTTPAPAPAEQRVPDGFVPDDVVQCTEGTLDDGSGSWQTAVATHYGGDYAALLAALAEPDDQAPFGQPVVCAAIGYLVSPLWLVDASGGAILVHHPVEVCGKPKTDIDHALAKLTVTGTGTVPIRLIASRAAIDAGCEPAWKYLPPSTADPGTASAVATTVPAKACAYAVGGDLGGGAYEGAFAHGRELSSAEAATAWTDAANAPTAPACDAVPTAFGILGAADGGAAFTWVELDGCRRVYPDGGPARVATPALLALFD